jgi:hypothetical protein
MIYQFESEEIKACMECPCCQYKYGKLKCGVVSKGLGYDDYYKEKSSWCPLKKVEVQNEYNSN